MLAQRVQPQLRWRHLQPAGSYGVPANNVCHRSRQLRQQAQLSRLSSARAAAEGAQPAEPERDSPAPAPALARPTRLQRQVEKLLALDVECAHFRLPGQRRVEHLPAEVCIVDARGDNVLHTYCNPLTAAQAGWEFVGGVPPAEWRGAPPLAEVRRQIQALVQGRLLVGHNLPQDLRTLGVRHPRRLVRDTMQYWQLQSGRGGGQRLAALAEQKLGRQIQAEGRRHDPREDALAALELYLQHVHFDPQDMGYEDLVEHHLAEILAQASSLSSAEGEGNEGEEAA